MERIKKIFKLLGPGLVTGASDDDPSGIGTYSQTGAQFGYHQLWTTFYTIPFMIVIQEIAGRIGMVSGVGLGGVIRKYYPKQLLYGSLVLLFIANVINIGADLGAMAASIQLLIHVPLIIWLMVFTIGTIILEILVPYRMYVRFLKWLSLVLLTYIVSAIFTKQDWLKIMQNTLMPYISLDKDYILNLVALVGTTISPYLFFWQSDHEVENRIEHDRQKDFSRGKGHVMSHDIRNLRVDTAAGMVFSNLIAFFIILTTASAFHTHGVHNVESADQAAKALEPVAGQFSSILFAAGIIGGGLLALPVLAGSTAYLFAETFKWKEGLNKKSKQAPRFYLIIAITIIFGFLLNFLPIKPFKLLYYSAAINGVTAAPIMILMLFIANNTKIMKDHTNSRVINIMGMVITAFMSLGAIILIGSFFFQ